MKIIKMLKFADLFTILNLVCAFVSIIFSIKNDFFLASIFLLLCVLFDFLDGKIARFMKSENKFGKELDSLSDIVAFGITPVIFGFCIGLDNILLISSLIFFLICSQLRLARFNILNIKGYIGMPVTLNGIIFPLLYFTLFNTIYFINILFFIYFILGILMISDIKFKKI